MIRERLLSKVWCSRCARASQLAVPQWGAQPAERPSADGDEHVRWCVHSHRISMSPRHDFCTTSCGRSFVPERAPCASSRSRPTVAKLGADPAYNARQGLPTPVQGLRQSAPARSNLPQPNLGDIWLASASIWRDIGHTWATFTKVSPSSADKATISTDRGRTSITKLGPDSAKLRDVDRLWDLFDPCHAALPA